MVLGDDHAGRRLRCLRRYLFFSSEALSGAATIYLHSWFLIR